MCLTRQGQRRLGHIAHTSIVPDLDTSMDIPLSVQRAAEEAAKKRSNIGVQAIAVAQACTV
jgi:hypothetical protein